MATPLSPNPPECQEISASWTNLAELEEREIERGATFPRKADIIKSTLQLKLAILSGGRDESGREIITFPSRPKALHYDHTQLLQTLQYLSIIPSPEALELGFALIVDGRLLSWQEIKLILRTSQEALPGQVHVAYVIQPTQFVNKRQTSLSLSKEKDKLEFSIVKISSTEKLLQQVDSRQVTTDLGGSLNYKHEEWLELRIKLEELLEVYQLFVERVSEIESTLRVHSRCPEKLSQVQTELSALSQIKSEIESADSDVNRLANELKLAIESACGSTGMTPERVNSSSKVNKIVQLTSQQCTSLLEQYMEQYRLLDQSNSVKQFDLGITKVMHWIKSKGLDEASSLEIGDSLASALNLQEKLTKLTTKVESMKEDITELKRMSDTMLGSEVFDRDKVKTKLNKMSTKYTKFTSAYQQRVNIVSKSVKMYQGLEEWRELYERLTVEWTRVKNETQSDEDCDQLLQSLDEDNKKLKELAHSVLKEGQELVKVLKDSGISQGDPEFRRSLRHISRATDEVTDKARRSQEIALAKYARLDQYSQLLVCEKDCLESVNKLKEHLKTLQDRSCVIGESLDATQSYLMELEEHRKEVEQTKDYTRGLLQSAVHQRQGLGKDTEQSLSLQTELDTISTALDDQFTLIQSYLQKILKIQTIHEGTRSTISYWGSYGEEGKGLSLQEIDGVLSNMEEKGNDMTTAVTISLKLANELKDTFSSFSLSSPSLTDTLQYMTKLITSLTHQKSLLFSLLTNRRTELSDRRRLLSLHQSNEEVLLWLREEGLPKLTSFCSLKFSLSDVQDQLTQFYEFKETCNVKTELIDKLYQELPKDEKSNTSSRTLLSAATKRSTDLQSIWRRFLIRVENREKVLTTLHQFLNQTMKLTSTMTEHLKSPLTSSSSITTDAHRSTIIQSSYDSVLYEGNRLLELLVKSPGGTQDSLIAEQIKDRMKQLSNLYQRQFLPFIQESSEGVGKISKGEKESHFNGLALLPIEKEETKEIKEKEEEEKKRLEELLREKRLTEERIESEKIRKEQEKRKEEEKQRQEEEKRIEEKRIKEKRKVAELQREKEVARRKEEERKIEEERKKLEEKRKQEEREKEEKRREEERRREKERRKEEERKKAEAKRKEEEKQREEIIRQKQLEKELEEKRKKEKERDEEKKKQELQTETLIKTSTTRSDDFQDLEVATDELLQKLFKCINQFLKSHSQLPATLEATQKELKDHEEFLASLQSSISELHIMSESLKAHISYNVKQKVLYLVDRIDGRVKERVSVVEKRITALNLIIKLYDMNEQCHKERDAFAQSLTNPYDPNITTEDTLLLLQQYQTHLHQLESLTETYSNQTRFFTSISSELEASGAEARRTLRGLLRNFEKSLSTCRQSYQTRKTKLEFLLKGSEIVIKQTKLLSWLNDTGLPLVNTDTALGTSASESTLLLEQAKAFAKEAKAIDSDISMTNSVANRLGFFKDNDVQSKASELKAKYKIISEKHPKRIQELEMSHDFFTGAETLLSDLNFALNQETDNSLNPIVAESQYSILLAQAKQLSTICHCNNNTSDINNGTIDSINYLLQSIDDKLGTYLLACENSFEDLEVSLSKLDTLLEDIDESVREELIKVTGSSNGMKKETITIINKPFTTTTTITTTTTTTSDTSKRADTVTLGSFKRPTHQSNTRQRLGSVNELKKMFESSNTTTANSNSPLLKKKDFTKPPPLQPLTSSLPRSISSPSSSPPSSPSSLHHSPPLTPPTPSIIATNKAIHEDAPTNFLSNEIPTSFKSPVDSSDTSDSSPPPTPPPPSYLSLTNEEVLPVRPPPPPDTPDYLLTEEENDDDEEEEEYRQERDNRQERVGRVMEEEKGDRKEEENEGERDELQEEEKEVEKDKEKEDGQEKEKVFVKIQLEADKYIMLPGNEELVDDNETKHNEQISIKNTTELIVEDSKGTTQVYDEILVDDLKAAQVTNDALMINDSIEVTNNEELEAINNDEEREVNGEINEVNSELLLSHLLGETDERREIIQQQYLYPLHNEIQHSTVGPVRILSPVFEDEGDRNDRPDIGWSSYPRRTNSKRMSSDDRAQWAQAHRQSLQSMRAILTSFYNNEVEYTQTLKRLSEVYCPILQYTGAYSQIHELVAFQMQFMNHLTTSLSNIASLCNCFQENVDNFKIYFPFVIYYDTSLSALSQCSTEELVVLTGLETATNEQLLQDYSSPYYRIETYCNLFQQLLQAAYKEDLMSLAALSETLELLLGTLRKLSTELATTKLHGCPFPVVASEFIAASPFLVHIANREKEVLMYTAFLHPEAIVLAERELDEKMEKTQYVYVMHISTSGLLLIENYHGLTDRFAICEKNQTSPDNIVVFRTCEDVTIKDYWVRQLQLLLSEQALEVTPQEMLQPEQVEALSHMIPTNAPPPPKPSKKLNPLRHKGKRIKTGRELIDGLENEIEESYSHIHRVVIEHTAPPTGNHNYLTVYEGDLVHVLEKEGLNSLIVTIPADSSDEEEEGYVPSCCLEPINTTEFKLVLNRNNNNNNSVSPPLLPPPQVDLLTKNVDLLNKETKAQDINITSPKQVDLSLSSNQFDLYNNEQDIYMTPPPPEVPLSSSSVIKSLERQWEEFCQVTGYHESFPNCQNEEELLQAKMALLYKYNSRAINNRDSLLVNVDEDDLEWELIQEDYGGEDDEIDSPINSYTHLTEQRKLLYQAPFLDNEASQEPSSVLLDGVFSLVHPYVAIQSIQATNSYQVSLRAGQFVRVLDSKRDDWWLVSTFPENDDIESVEGWVNRSLLQHAAYIREETVDHEVEPNFPIRIWLVLADYIAEAKGTVSITKGGLVEVIDQSQTQWSLIRTIGRYPTEGWVPSEFIRPYNFSDQGPQSPEIRPTSAGADSSSTEGYFDTNNTPDPLSPCLSVGELNEEQKKEAAEHRDFTQSELLSSEREYIERLGYCLSQYKSTIDDDKEGTVPKSLKPLSNELFCNIQDIYDFHKKEILPSLEQCADNLNGIVDLFALSGPSMKALYVIYCKGKHRSEDIYKEYIDYLQELSYRLKDRLSLRDYLILPIQRITKYNLLLKSLYELSNKAGSPVPHFKSALAVTHDVSRQANNVVHMSLIEGIEKKLDEFGELALQDTFGVCDTNIQRGLFKERQVFLFEKALTFTKKRAESGERETYMTKEVFMLQGVSFSEDTDIERRNIVIYDISTGNKFTLKAALTKVRDEWLTKAQELISIARRPALAFLERGTRSRSVSEPLEINISSVTSSRQNSANLAGHLLRQGSQRTRKTARSSRPSSASHSREEKPQSGTQYVVMECVVLEGGDDCQLEPKEIVELVRVEESGLLRVRTADGQEGLLPPGFVRKKDAVTEGDMETAPKITVSPPDQTLFLHDRFSVSCAFNGMPSPLVVWKRDESQIIVDDNRIRISSCDTSSVLEILDLSYDDEGEYSCIVSNKLGHDITTMELLMEGPPSAPSKPIASRPTTTSVKLKWNPPEHDGHYPITSYLVEQLQEGFDDWRPIVQQLKTSFTVKTLEPNTWYQFRIIANNDQGGASEPSSPSEIVFTTKNKGVHVGWMSPSTKKRFFIDTDSIKDDTSAGDVMIRSPIALTSVAHQEDDLSRTSSACVLDSSEIIIRKDSIHFSYDVLPGELGRGQYGIIRRCVNKCNGAVLAAKYLKESNEALQEIKLLNNLSSSTTSSCPHIVKLVDTFLTDDNLVIVTELLHGGELIDWILMNETNFTEELVITYMRQLLVALEYIHDRKIVHLDIKPENILLTSDAIPKLKLIDFGSAQELPFVTSNVRPDSIEFSSPELVFDNHVTKSADLWSVGVLTYILLSGVSPFFNDNTAIMSQKLARVQYDFSLQIFHNISSKGIDFMSSLLKKSPHERLTATSALNHAWIKGSPDTELKLDTTKLKAFHARRRMQSFTKAAKTTSIFNPHIPRISSPDYEGTDLPELAPTFEGGTEEIQAPVGASVILEWDYTGHPEPTVEWERNERLVASSGGRVNITTGGGVAKLSINEVVRSDEGIYTCCILNSLGSDVRECRLIVIDKPSSPSNITGVLLGSSTSVLVSWLPPVNDGHSPVTHYILETCQIEDNQWLLVDDRISTAAHVVEDLLPGKNYVFRVASVNVIGVSPFSKPSAPLLIICDDDEDSPPCSTPLATELQIRNSDFNLEYELITEIGSGSFSTVYECVEITTDRSFAAKFITCSSVEDYQFSAREVEMIKNIKHPRIAFLEDAFKTPTHTILILEFVPCGDLHSFITINGFIDEQKAARYIRHILEGLEYLHSRNTILINIAPDNLVLGAGYQEIKIIDFSYAQYISDDNQLEVLPLSIDYLSPEAVQFNPLTGSTDMWSVGGVAIYMLSGHCPFISDSRSGLISNIQSLCVNHECDTVIKRLSPDCSNVLFDCLLTRNPRKRLSSHQCQRHRWLQLGSSAATRSLSQLQHMDTKEQVEYFMRKYPSHFHQFSDPS